MIRRGRHGEVLHGPAVEPVPVVEETASERQHSTMIKLTRLDASHIYVNADLVEFLEETPDTVVSLTTGRKLVVRESAQQVGELIVDYQRRVHGADRTAAILAG